MNRRAFWRTYVRFTMFVELWWHEIRDRLPWIQKSFSEGWDTGIEQGAEAIEKLLAQLPGPNVPRELVEQVAARLRCELEGG
ncbi:hypothetical protein [Kribbella catacumbae]|uniref:hypothetical protein n=1 Tax=Kribbella catacumbae TaxID=460086 RepID=UPI0003A65DC6|nr:hypothetical protein [Kribbella catacumbae]